MRGLRQIIPALGLATAVMAAAFSVSAVYAGGSAAASPDTADAAGSPNGSGAPGWRHGPHGGGALGPMGHVLHQLNLSADQKAQIKSIMAGQKIRFETLHQSVKTNMHLLATTSTTDPGYPELVQIAQSNASARIALMSDTWKQIYENVLNSEQQKQIPALVTAAEQARASRMGNWKAPAPSSN